MFFFICFSKLFIFKVFFQEYLFDALSSNQNFNLQSLQDLSICFHTPYDKKVVPGEYSEIFNF